MSFGAMQGSLSKNGKKRKFSSNKRPENYVENNKCLSAPGPCIRCGNCINACPMGLSPVEIAGAYTKNDGEMLDKLMVDLCIGCGTCSYVCPAKRPVTQTMNLAKAVWQKNKNGGKK